tara:strand:- start:735 stop:1025 length:291 start_codon:yes stop_codon:yes gene_type:complete
MPYREFIESLPISDYWKSGLLDLCLWFGVSVLNVYDKNVFTVVFSIFSFALLVIRLARMIIDTRKSHYELKITKHEHDNIKDKEKDTTVYKMTKQK